MSKGETWTNYLILSLVTFLFFMLELFSIFVIEKMILNVSINNYTETQMGIHSLLTSGLWAVAIIIILFFSYKKYNFPKKSYEKIYKRNWMIVFIALALCKVITFIDYGTLKVIGEFEEKGIFRFSAQYIYYFFEIGLVLLIIMYGQKAIEVLLKRKSEVPFGGIILALTWGAFHFVSRGKGIEVWNGVSCMIFSILSGIIYLNVKRKIPYSYLLIAIGYLL
ncbi:hypothetical protein [Clostridium tertium]|uniref:CAAX amino terminal protease self- immunity n=1 Tax=Clostridium tertium TaxID=1559 RepID=A0A6N3F2F9_9CLOT